MNERTQELVEQCWDERLDGRHFDKEKFAELVRQDEREACAKLCETFYNHGAKYCAELIRARGER